MYDAGIGYVCKWLVSQTNMNIASAATAFPKHYYPQNVLSAAFRRYWNDKLEDAGLFERLQAHVGVDGRYLVRPRRLRSVFELRRDERHLDPAATDLAEEATSCALGRAGLDRSDLDAIFFVSVTGIASPSIDARLVNRMGLAPRIRRTPIFGLGCVAGAAGLSRAADYVRAYPAQTALLVSVEICSLTIQRDDLSIANLISSGLFGDGAAAVIVAGAGARPERPAHYRDAIHLLSQHRRRDGLEHLRKGLPHRPVAGSAGDGA